VEGIPIPARMVGRFRNWERCWAAKCAAGRVTWAEAKLRSRERLDGAIEVVAAGVTL
jgi:hypothetical protein